MTKRKIGKKGFKLIHASGDFLSRSDAAKKNVGYFVCCTVSLFNFIRQTEIKCFMRLEG